MEYKIEAFSQVWSAQGLCEKATRRTNELAREGWRVSKMQQGWSTTLFSTLYIIFEREMR